MKMLTRLGLRSVNTKLDQALAGALGDTVRKLREMRISISRWLEVSLTEALLTKKRLGTQMGRPLGRPLLKNKRELKFSRIEVLLLLLKKKWATRRKPPTTPFLTSKRVRVSINGGAVNEEEIRHTDGEGPEIENYFKKADDEHDIAGYQVPAAKEASGRNR
jgi:hypothetical protein